MKRTGGRVRSQGAHDDALQAATQILEESGYGAVTVEGVAAKSGVAKSTLYRWWPSKAELVMEAYTSAVRQRMPLPDTGSLHGDLTAYLEELYRVTEYPARVKALCGLMAQAQLDEAFKAHFQQWVQERREVLKTLLRRWLPAEADLEHAADLVYGLFWYRIMVEHAPIEPKLAADHASHVLKILI